MNSKRYEQVAELYHAALDLPAEQRSTFLASACADDESLRSEVTSLLEANEAAGDFILTSAMSVSARSIAQDEEAEMLTGRVGAYDVVALLGRGGMGEVYQAFDTRLGRTVALKLLRPTLTRNPDAVRRFEREARAASSLNHPNIVTVYDIGEIDGRSFLAMEFVQGQPLATLINSRLGLGAVARIGAQLATALAVAHAAGIVHRDIKPENIVVRGDGYVKLLDFGLARLVPQHAGAARPDEHATEIRTILGTPRYMSPEQALGATTMSASDVFSLGVVLFELASGTHPFESASEASDGPGGPDAVPMRSWQIPGMPQLEGLLRRMLDTHPAARPSASDVAAELTTLAFAVSPPFELDALTARRETRAHNLPPPRTPLVGRSTEIADLSLRLLDPQVRLLTLTGPGGTGKTRLATHVAAEVASSFAGGVSFVDLAPISAANLVASTVAHALGVSDAGERRLVTALAEHLNTRGSTLLLIDNFEQVSEAAGIVRDMLDASPGLTVLVTSRHALRIYGEQEFPLAPLPLPDPEVATTPSALLDCPSVTLFVQRATAVRPDFALTAKNAPAVVNICRHLDGLPLAIELAAARVKIVPPAELFSRLERRLELLIGGARDLPERQQTMRRAISWSYDLLTPGEQKLFRRLSVFVGGCTLEAIEAVCNTREDLGMDVLEGVASLVDNSLLVRPVSDDSSPRLFMLETFREYARDRLMESGEWHETSRALAAYVLVLAEEGPLAPNAPEREPWLRGCEAEHANIRAAFVHLLGSGNVEWALRLSAALFGFWEQREYVTEGRETFARVLAMPGAAPPTLRARALYGVSVLDDVQADFAAAEAHSHEAFGIYRELGDVRSVAITMTAMAVQAQHAGRHAEATARHAETVSLWREVGDAVAVDLARFNMANAAKAQGDLALAESIFDDLLLSSEARQDLRAVATTLSGLGDIAAARGEFSAARRCHQRSLVTFRQIDDRWGIAQALSDLGDVDLRAGEYAAASKGIGEALSAFRALGHQRGVARQLERLSCCASCEAMDAVAVTLASAAATIRTRIGTPSKTFERARVEDTLARARRRLSLDDFNAAWHVGSIATLDAILEAHRRAPRDSATDTSADPSAP